MISLTQNRLYRFVKSILFCHMTNAVSEIQLNATDRLTNEKWHVKTDDFFPAAQVWLNKRPYLKPTLWFESVQMKLIWWHKMYWLITSQLCPSPITKSNCFSWFYISKFSNSITAKLQHSITLPVNGDLKCMNSFSLKLKCIRHAKMKENPRHAEINHSFF